MKLFATCKSELDVLVADKGETEAVLVDVINHRIPLKGRDNISP